MNITNKIALVTGGSRGLGKDMAIRLADKGLDVIVTYNSKVDEAQAVVEQLQQSGRKAAALHLNVGDLKSFNAFITQLKAILKDTFSTDHLDFLINNAGVGRYAPIGNITEELFDELLNVHFKGVVFLTQAMLPLLNDGGGIVNISTGTARISFNGSSTYSAMKGAVEVFTRYLAKELGPRGIRANIVAPGAVLTDFGGVVAFLCTDDARWVNGQRLEVSGGMFV